MFETMAKVQYSLKPKNEVPETSVLKSFSWDGYISGTDDKPAPRSCFKQTMDPPPNEFKAGMKLESRDPRNTMSFCIATVIYASGPRLCLRLDGSDNRNDFWSLVDSGDIHPYGWCAEQGDQLQPPLGFAKNSSYFPLFLSKLLQESKDLMAPSSCFKTVPVGPERNMFEVGMKLEAIDTKNPYLIAPATIGNVDGDKVYIQFDGWKGAFDYWCRYDSRNIFPVGWCAAAGHILQFPGGRGNAPRARGSSSSKSQSVSPNIAVHVDTQLPHSVGEPSPGSVKSAGTTSKKNSPAVSAASTTVAVAQKLLSPETPISPAAVNGDTVTAYVNQTCRCGPLLNQTRIIRLPLHYGPGVVSRMLKKIIQALVDSAVNPAQIFNNLVTSASSSTITAKISGKVTTCTIPAVSTEEEFTDYISNTLQSIECCVNLITLQPLRQICDKCSVSTSVSNHSLKRAYSTIDGSVTAGGKKRRAYRTMSVPVGRGRGRKRRGSLRHDMNANITSPSASAPFSPRLDSQMTSPVSVTDLTDIAANPYDWSADEVIRYVRCKDPSLSKQAHLIEKHEIDGRAFLLMTSDIAIKYMQMKVGPALKMCSLIDQLRLSMRY